MNLRIMEAPSTEFFVRILCICFSELHWQLLRTQQRNVSQGKFGTTRWASP